MELQTLLPLTPEIWAKTLFCSCSGRAGLAASKDVTPLGVAVPAQLVLGSLALLKSLQGWHREGGTGRDRPHGFIPISSLSEPGLCVPADHPEHPSKQAAAVQPKVRGCPGVHFSHGEPPE